MQLTKGISIMDLGLCIESNLILADIHLGYEESQNRKGVLIPRVFYKALTERLAKSLEGKHFTSIILNGDVKHEFGSIAPSEWRTILSFIDFLRRYTDKIVIIEGNHDPLLKHITAKRNVSLVEHVSLGNTYITHGDVIPKDKEYEAAEIIVIGHDHPAISLRKMARVETYKCFLKGKWKGKTLIVMPSCNLLTEGSNVLSRKALSPFLKDREDCELYVVGDNIYRFGKIKDIREKM